MIFVYLISGMIALVIVCSTIENINLAIQRRKLAEKSLKCRNFNSDYVNETMKDKM